MHAAARPNTSGADDLRMILLDTKLVSEPWKPKRDAHVVAWIDAQAVETLYLSAVTVAELRFAIAAMPVGQRRRVLHDRLEGELLAVFAGRVLPFDLDASRAYADLMAKTKIAGLAISMADGNSRRLPRRAAFLWPRAMLRRLTRLVSALSTHGRPRPNGGQFCAHPGSFRYPSDQRQSGHGETKDYPVGQISWCAIRHLPRRNWIYGVRLSLYCFR